MPIAQKANNLAKKSFQNVKDKLSLNIQESKIKQLGSFACDQTSSLHDGTFNLHSEVSTIISSANRQEYILMVRKYHQN